MSSKILIPRKARIFPTKESRKAAAAINAKYSHHDFNTYNDWFYFIHIDPAQRLLHALGMSIGSIIYILMIVEWSWLSILYYFIGTFFFYVVGIISHIIYDKGTARSDVRFLLTTFWPVIRINLLTLSGYYDKDLREFTKKYPFVKDAHQLVEIERKDFLKALLRK